MTLARKALDIAPAGPERRHWERINDVLVSGRAIRVATFPATFATGDGVGQVELIAAVEAIFDD
jgi:hypothetical protein